MLMSFYYALFTFLRTCTSQLECYKVNKRSYCVYVRLTVFMYSSRQADTHITDEQAGFWNDRNTIQQIRILRLIAEKAYRKGVANIPLFYRLPEGIRYHQAWCNYGQRWSSMEWEEYWFAL